MFCVNCKAKIRNDSRVCPHCGQAVEDYSFPVSNNQPFYSHVQETTGIQRKIIIGFIAFCWIAVLLGHIFMHITFSNRQDNSNSYGTNREQAVIRISNRGFNITWDDFKNLDCVKTAEKNQQFLNCDISDTFELFVEGNKKEKHPDKVELALKINNSISLDIRSGNAEKFIEEYDGLN